MYCAVQTLETTDHRELHCTRDFMRFSGDRKSEMLVFMYGMVITYSRVWINRIRLPILLEVTSAGKNKYFPVSVRA